MSDKNKKFILMIARVLLHIGMISVSALLLSKMFEIIFKDSNKKLFPIICILYGIILLAVLVEDIDTYIDWKHKNK